MVASSHYSFGNENEKSNNLKDICRKVIFGIWIKSNLFEIYPEQVLDTNV